MTDFTSSPSSSEWYTPSHIIDAARKLMGEITLDPASCESANAHVGAKGFYGKTLNGMLLPWHGNVWLNPPYGFDVETQRRQRQGDWIKKALVEYKSGRVNQACLLVQANTAQKWFQPLWKAGPMCFFSSRLRFVNPNRDGRKDQPKHAHCLVWLPPNTEWGVDEAAKMTEVFKDLGRVVVSIGS